VFQIDVSLEVYKALTSRLRFEKQSYDDVIREMLKLDSPVEIESPAGASISSLQNIAEAFSQSFADVQPGGGFYSRGLLLPNGTKIRARYKQKLYRAEVQDDIWVDADGRKHSSPSAAAAAITGTNVNGWRFWEALRPGDKEWARLELLKSS